MRIIKKLFSIIGTLFMIAVITVGGLFVTYKYFGTGITFNGREIIINIKDFLTTIPLSEIPSMLRTDDVSHKDHDTYYELSANEKVIYDALLKKSKDILINNDNDLKFNVSLGSFYVILSGEENYTEIETKINNEISNMNFNKIFNSLRADYPYYFWYLYSSSYSYTEPRIIVNGNDFSQSYFQIELISLYDSNGEVNTELLNTVRTYYQNAKKVAYSVSDKTTEEKIKYFVDYIIENTDYYNEYSSDPDESSPWSTFISVFDENPDTLSICGGYADAFQLLCDLSDIDCYTAMGYMKDDLHAWNEVYLDGQKYLIDITNMDKGTVGEGYKLYMKPINENEYSVKVYDEYIEYKKISLDNLVNE